MTLEQKIEVDGKIVPVVLSDRQETLLAAKAAGRVIVGLLHEGGDRELPAAEYLVTDPEAADGRYLERAARRQMGLFWMIEETERLIIREFTAADAARVPREPGDTADDAVFYTPELLAAYIRHQYRFFEYGMWAVARKSDGVIVGTVGVTDGVTGADADASCVDSAASCVDGVAPADSEAAPDSAVPPLFLGYHIFLPYRRQGFAGEACRAVIAYAAEEFQRPVWAVIDGTNRYSLALARKLGGRLLDQRYSEAGQLQYRYGWNC